LRLTGSPEEAEPYYQRYLDLSDFESSTSGKVFNYWVRGFLIGGGKKRRAGQKDIWNDLRSLAYFGLGDCARLLKKPDPAIANYQKALSFDEEDPQVHWALGLAFTTKAEVEQSPEPLLQAKRHFETVIRLNEHLEEAEKARKYIAKIDSALAQAGP
jgi:tetratricopeptide (TPR) repeat protein